MTNDRQLLTEKACFTFFLKRWRGQLLIHETEGDADAIEMDRRILDYYLDKYNELATFSSPFPRQKLSQERIGHSWQQEHTGQNDNTLPFSAIEISASKLPIRSSRSQASPGCQLRGKESVAPAQNRRAFDR